ncbi:MAG: nucleotidyltransferase domain-containing protein [Clostridia bacterium]|nr:nucleotidyltransferase domain-containing protein [Clostridia bacterium]
MFGLSEQVLSQIKEVIQKYNYKFVIFGSRAKGNFKDNSDIDIAVLGEVDFDEKIKIKDELTSLNIPYFVDVVFVNSLVKQELINSINNDGVEL